MLIGEEDHCYLRIERVGSELWGPFRVEARGRHDDVAEVYAFNGLLVVSTGDSDRAAFVEFWELRSHRLVLGVSEEGSLDLQRDPHGHIHVHFSLGCIRLGPHWKATGVVRIEGECSQEFLRNFRRLIFGEG